MLLTIYTSLEYSAYFVHAVSLFLVLSTAPLCQKKGSSEWSARADSGSDQVKPQGKTRSDERSDDQRRQQPGRDTRNGPPQQKRNTGAKKKTQPAPPPPPKLNIRPPKETNMKGTFDPNYQTLAGLNNDDVFKPKDGGAKAANAGGGGQMKIRPPKETHMKGTFDPNYQTLAGLNNDDVFKPKDGGGGQKNAACGGDGGQMKIRPPKETHMKGTFDPNYQTLAGLNNDDVFKAKDGGGGQQEKKIVAPQQKGVVGTYDPNYQTLANLGNDCFGADKKKTNEPQANFYTY